MCLFSALPADDTRLVAAFLGLCERLFCRGIGARSAVSSEAVELVEDAARLSNSRRAIVAIRALALALAATDRTNNKSALLFYYLYLTWLRYYQSAALHRTLPYVE